METLPRRLYVVSNAKPKKNLQTHAHHSTPEPIHFTLFVSATKNPKRPPDVGSEASKNTINVFNTGCLATHTTRRQSRAVGGIQRRPSNAIRSHGKALSLTRCNSSRVGAPVVTAAAMRCSGGLRVRSAAKTRL